jgi:hypothetical protein
VPMAPAPPDNGDSAAYWAASDFWGEDAAQVHDAVEAPAPPARPSGVSHNEVARPPATRRFPRVPALTAIAIAAAAAITAIAINALGSAPAARLSTTSSLHATAPARSTSGASAAKSATTAAAGLRLTAAASRHQRTQRAHPRIRTGSTRAHARHTTSRNQHRGTTVAATTVVHYVAPAPTSTPASSAYQLAHATSANTPTPAGPTGPASLIGPGTSSSG